MTPFKHLSEEQCARLLEEAQKDSNPQIYLFILIAVLSGMRRTEILTIKLENIHLDQSHVYLPKAKAGARGQHISSILVDFLRQHLATLPTDQVWLFPSIGNHKSKYGHTTTIE